MIEKHTILILGAGASMDYGFPSGKELIRDIINLLHGSIYSLPPEYKKKCIALALMRYYKMKLHTERTFKDCLEKVENFKNSLIQASPASIDDFIDKNQEKEFDIIGKICIVLCISRYEKPDENFFIQNITTPSGHSYYDDTFNLNHWEIREGWYRYLWTKVYEGSDINKNLNKLTFITFNYDRSLEYFLYSSFKNMLGKSSEEAAELFNENVFIYHVYGQIGYLDWQNKGGIAGSYDRLSLEAISRTISSDQASMEQLIKGNLIPNVDASLEHILSLANEIRTYTEAAEANITPIRNRAFKAQVIFFLGFGYHPQNLDWLKNVMRDSNEAIAVGTTYGLGKLQARRIWERLTNLYPFRMTEKIDGTYTELKIQDLLLNEFDIE